MRKHLWLAALFVGVIGGHANATETENLGIRVLPAPGKVTVDAKCDDWDLSGGVFVCGDVENLREKVACWFHLMWDQDNLYVLARWIDETPMNNPGNTAGDMGFRGDCLQVRTIVGPGCPAIVQGGGSGLAMQRTTHLTAWHGSDGKDVMDTVWGLKFDGGGMKDAREQGAEQAFAKNPDGKGYVQEIRLPWKMLAPEGWRPAAGAKMVVTVEPNFGTEANFRITLKDIFRPGVTPDRVFAFMASPTWGIGTFEGKGRAAPAPLRLSDARDFNVRMEGGVPVIDWTGLYRQEVIEGFAPIRFRLPQDGYVSLNIKNAAGEVVRQLLTANFFTRGEHEVKWDGLGNKSDRVPGEVQPNGDYRWEAIWHRGVGLRLVGWACNGGRAPFDSPGGNWGGDMAPPVAVTTTGDSMILGWTWSEAGQAVVCTDLEGKVKWRHKRGGFGGAALVAAQQGIVYVYDLQKEQNTLYRLTASKGEYSPWEGSNDATIDVGHFLNKDKACKPCGLDAAGGKLFLAYGSRTSWGETQESGDAVAVLDAKTGKLLKTLAVADPGDIEACPDGKLCAISAGTSVVRIDPATGVLEAVVKGLHSAAGIAIDKEGDIYVGVGEPDNQIQVFSKAGRPLRTIGRKGGRPLLGAWDPSGVRFVTGLRVDAQGKLWVMESDWSPKRVSVWNAADGKFLKEFFGPTAYGAGGGAISPDDPLVMVGHGCEWKLDPETGRGACVAVLDREGWSNARFGRGPGGRLYLAVASTWNGDNVRIYERLGPAQWKLRTRILKLDKDGNAVTAVKSGKITGYAVWSDANDDQQEQPEELQRFPGFDPKGSFSGWYMSVPQTLIFYAGCYRVAPTGWTACGAPQFDLGKATKMPVPPDFDIGRGSGMGMQRGHGTEDGRFILYNGFYGASHSTFECYDVESGKHLWSYPNNYVGVHGGHNAPSPAVGMIRGAYDIVGSVKLPEPIGDVWAIPTDKGEWHLLTRDGYYLSRLFQPDGLKVQWPEQAIPGAICDNTPPGMGAEDFGGSIMATRDGQLYVQAGKTAFINMRVVGLDAVKKLGGGTLKVSQQDCRWAVAYRQRLNQAAVGLRQTTVKKKTVAFTGDLRKDFDVKEPLRWAKNDSGVEAALAWDDASLYAGFSVQDSTPWINGATEAAVMYAKGDTIDLQLATDPQADPKRGEAAAGDLRLSIGNFHGKPAAVIYRPISLEKRPRKFYSGTVKDGWEVQCMKVLENVKIELKVDPRGKRYVVEVAIPMAELGIRPAPGLRLRGDMGVTYGNPAGDKTVLRNYWSNQATDFVADEVWELKLEPRNWGQIVLE